MHPIAVVPACARLVNGLLRREALARYAAALAGGAVPVIIPPIGVTQRAARTRIGAVLALFAACAALSACAAQVVQNKEDMLAAAGFTLVPANTPQRQTALTTLPPHKFVHQVRNNVVVYTYADPTICNCLYVGNQAAYDRYRANVFQKQLADERAFTAQINEMNWGPWGPGWYY